MNFIDKLALKIASSCAVKEEAIEKDIKDSYDQINRVDKSPIRRIGDEREEDLIDNSPQVIVEPKSTYPHDDVESLVFFDENDIGHDDVEVGALGRELQKALNDFGLIRKGISLNPKIVLEDLRSESGISIYYFKYSKDVEPQEFIRFSKDGGNFMANLNAVLIADGVEVSYAGHGLARVRIMNGRVL